MAPLDNNRQISFVSHRPRVSAIVVTDGGYLQSFVHFDFSGSASLNWRDRRPISEVTSLLEGWDETLVE